MELLTSISLLNYWMVSILTAYLQKPKNSFIRLDSLGWDTIRVNYIPLPENAFNAELHLRLYRYVTSNSNPYVLEHGLRTPREEIAFTAWPKIQSQSQIFRYGGSIFCLPHRPKFSDIFDLCLHWVSVVRVLEQWVAILSTV